MSNELTVVVEQSGLEKSKTEVLLSRFGVFFDEAKQIAEQSKSIVVTSEDDIDGMTLARQNRLELKKVRVSVDKTRKELKEQSLREGRAIDGIANVIKALIVPVEQHLEKQEKFAEYKEAERLLKRENNRISKLSAYVDDVSLYKLREMSDEAFEQLLKSSKLAFEAQKKAEQEAEKERIKQQEALELMRKRQLALASYGALTDFEVELDTTEKEFRSALSNAEKAKQEYEAEQMKIRKENEKLQKEKVKAEEARLKAEAKLKAEMEAKEKKEREERERLKAEQKAKKEAEQKALLAPDKEKLLKLVRILESIEYPAFKSKKAVEFYYQIRDELDKVIVKIKQEAKSL